VPWCASAVNQRHLSLDKAVPGTLHILFNGINSPFALGLLGQLLEVLHSLRNGLAKQTDFDATSGLTANGDVKENLRNQNWFIINKSSHLIYGAVDVYIHSWLA